MLKIVAIVVTYNGMKWYDRCFGSLLRQSVPIDVVAVDNASTDGTVTYINENYTDVTVIEAGDNLGFAKANNIGLRYAVDHRADYVLLLNQDAWFESPDGVLKMMEQSKANPQYWILSPMQVYAGSRRIENEVKVHLARSADADNDVMTDAYYGRLRDVYPVEYSCAFCWLLPISTVKKTGGFDPLFYHYGEDDNYQQRVGYHGGKTGLCPKVTVCHDIEQRNECYRAVNLDWRKYLLINYCNINMPLDMEMSLRLKRRMILIQLLRLNRKHLKESIPEYRYLKEKATAIELSRKQNMLVGENWIQDI